jgi:hypothetical protein
MTNESVGCCRCRLSPSASAWGSCRIVQTVRNVVITWVTLLNRPKPPETVRTGWLPDRHSDDNCRPTTPEQPTRSRENRPSGKRSFADHNGLDVAQIVRSPAFLSKVRWLTNWYKSYSNPGAYESAVRASRTMRARKPVFEPHRFSGRLADAYQPAVSRGSGTRSAVFRKNRSCLWQQPPNPSSRHKCSWVGSESAETTPAAAGAGPPYSPSPGCHPATLPPLRLGATAREWVP